MVWSKIGAIADGVHSQMNRSGSSHSGGSVRGMTHQHDQLMRKQQQQALMNSQQHQQQQQQQQQQRHQQQHQHQQQQYLQQQQQQHTNLGKASVYFTSKQLSCQ